MRISITGWHQKLICILSYLIIIVFISFFYPIFMYEYIKEFLKKLSPHKTSYNHQILKNFNSYFLNSFIFNINYYEKSTRMYLFKKNKNLVTYANNAVLTSTFILALIFSLKSALFIIFGTA